MTTTEIADTTETSIEIINAIAKRVGHDENAILAYWADPQDAQAIIDDAVEATDDDALFWGASGIVWEHVFDASTEDFGTRA